MGLLRPDEPDFDVDEWRSEPPPERNRLMCVTWATQGFGAPDVVYVLYFVKLVVYVGGFLAWAAITPSLGGPASIGSWWSHAEAFKKAVVWTLLFEVTGFGCGSGPLTGHYGPMFPAARHWLRPGTIRLRPFDWVPWTAGHRRTSVDVVLYTAILVAAIVALASPEIATWHAAALIVATVLCGLRDKTIFLAARSEHYLLTSCVMLFPSDLWPGSQAVQLTLWLGAAVSKLTHHFPAVMAVMQSNSPVFRSRRARERLWARYPDDLRVSTLSIALAHTATALEFGFPLAVAFAPSGPWHTTALVVMVLFHLGILTSAPMGVPLEWNVFFIYSGLVLFGAHDDERVWHISSPLLVAVLVGFIAIGPIWGNLRPDKISFLPALRYYAGNWAPSVWLFRPGVLERIEERLVLAAPRHSVQLEGNIEPGTFDVTMARGQAMRSMHLHGRALATLLPGAVADLAPGDDRVAQLGTDAFELLDGEMIAGWVLGWNFGDGHLHNEQLLAAIAAECDIGSGDIRCVLLESQPLHRQQMAWRIVDGADGQLDAGTVSVDELRARQPWGAMSS